MARKRKTFPPRPRPPPPRNNDLASNIGAVYALVLRGVSTSGQQSESNATLELLSKLQQEKETEEQDNNEQDSDEQVDYYHSGYNPYNVVETDSLYSKDQESSAYPEYNQYQGDASTQFETQEVDKEDIMRASTQLTNSSGSYQQAHSSTQPPAPTYQEQTVEVEKETIPNSEIIGASQQLAPPASKLTLPQDDLVHAHVKNNESLTSNKHQNEDENAPTALALNIKSVLENLSNLGAMQNVGALKAAEGEETTIETTGNKPIQVSGDVLINNSNDKAQQHSTCNVLENSSIKTAEGASPLSIGKSENVISHHYTNGSSFTDPERDHDKPEDLPHATSFNNVSHKPVEKPLHEIRKGNEVNQLVIRTNDAFNQQAENAFQAPWERMPALHHEERINWVGNTSIKSDLSFLNKLNEQGFGHAELKKDAPSINLPVPEFSKSTYSTSPVGEPNQAHSFDSQSDAAYSSKSQDSHSNNTKPSKDTFQEYLRFGRHDIFKGESWASHKDSARTSHTDSYSAKCTLGPRLSPMLLLEHRGTDSHKPRTWVREGFEPPTKKHKLNSVNPKFDSYRPKHPGDRRNLGGSNHGSLKSPYQRSGFNNSSNKKNTANFKIFGNLKFETIPYTSEEVQEFLNINPSHPNLKVAYFVQTSQELIHKAHESLVVDKSFQSVLNYYKFIRGAIKCLLILVKKYPKDLTPHQLASLYYKIAKLYLTETESFDLAEAYALKTQTINRDHSIVEFEFYCDLLLIDIYEKINISTIGAFALRREAYYEEAGYHLLSNCMKMVRIKYLMISDASFALVNLQRLVNDPKLDPTVKKIAIVYLAGLHNHRGNPAAVADLLRGFEVNISQPFAAYILMTRLLASVSLNNVSESKHLLKELMSLSNDGEKSHWNQWLINGDIKFHIGGESGLELDFVISWLPVVDFKIMLYFLSGVAYLHLTGDRSKLCFEKAIALIQSAQDDLEMNRNLAKHLSAHESRQRELKLRYYRYSVQYYRQWQLFLNGDSKIVYLNEFMNANNRLFTREEYTMFKPIYTYVHYMFALYYHSRGDLQAAKFYYLKVRNMTGILYDNDASMSLQQMTNGLGGDSIRPQGKFSDLNVYSTFHLIILLDYEVNEIMLKEENDESKLAVEKLTAIENNLLDDFAQVNKPPKNGPFQCCFVINNRLLQMTLEIVMRMVHNLEPDFNVKNVMQMLGEIGDRTTFYFIYFFLTYVLVLNISSTSDKTRYIKRCLHMLPQPKTEVVETPVGKEQVSTSESVDSCRVFLLRSLMEVDESNGLHTQVDLEKGQLERLCKLVAHRYTTLEENVTYDPTFKVLSQVKSVKNDVEIKDV